MGVVGINHVSWVGNFDMKSPKSDIRYLKGCACSGSGVRYNELEPVANIK